VGLLLREGRGGRREERRGKTLDPHNVGDRLTPLDADFYLRKGGVMQPGRFVCHFVCVQPHAKK